MQILFILLKYIVQANSTDYINFKLLLNTLYDSIDLYPKMENHLIIIKEDILKLNTQRVITNVIDKNGKELVSFFDDCDWNLDLEKQKS